MSLDAATPNPKAGASSKYGEYDYSSSEKDSINKRLYNKPGNMLPFVGNTTFSSLFNRSRFWTPDKDLLTAVAANKLNTADMAAGSGSYEHTNLLNFANVGTEEFSILVFKPENLAGYDITAESWYNGKENIPYGWIRPSDYISDYFLQVICVKGNWTNYPILSSDSIWSGYFDINGIIKSRINNFLGADGIQVLGSWIGCIIPDFVNRQGENLSLERKINSRTEVTGLLMSFNEDAAHVLAGDYTGPDLKEADDDYDERVLDSKFMWGIDIDGDHELDSEYGEGKAPYIIDMVGHNIFAHHDEADTTDDIVGYQYMTFTEKPEGMQPFTVTLTGTPDEVAEVVVTKDGSYTYEFDNEVADIDSLNVSISGVISGVTCSTPVVAEDKKSVTFEVSGFEPAIYKIDEFTEKVIPEGETEEVEQTKEVYISEDLINYKSFENLQRSATTFSIAKAKSLLSNSTYTLKTTPKGKATEKTTPKVTNVDIVFFDINEDGDMITNLSQVESSDLNQRHTLKLRFNIEDVTYFAYFTYTGIRQNRNFMIYSIIPGCNHDEVTGLQIIENLDSLGKRVLELFPGAKVIKDEDGNDCVQIVEHDDVAPASKVEVPETLRHILIPMPNEDTDVSRDVKDGKHCLGFLSYTFNEEQFMANEADENKYPKLDVTTAYYFNDPKLYAPSVNDPENIKIPVDETALNMFIIQDINEADKITVGTYVRNITFNNLPGEANKYKLIPGITRIIDKRFIPFTMDSKGNYMAIYRGQNYTLNSEVFNKKNNISIKAKNGATGVYLYTAVDPVLLEDNEYDETGKVVNQKIVRQLPLSHDTFSHSLRFIPMKGLKITSKHRPGYDENGNISIEGGISKIYSVLEDPGIQRGLCNPTMVDYRYIVDSMSYGLDSGLGGKSYLTRLAENRGKTLAILNLPSAKQFAVSANPIFCDSYTMGVQTKPSFDTKYIPMGGNLEMGSSKVFSLPDEANGSKYAAAFWPNLIYTENGKQTALPPAADVCNVLSSKFTGITSPYAINANMNGIIHNRFVTGVEFDADSDDRGYLEPMGVNTIIRESGNVMIYGNQTCYQTTKSDMNKLHVRETLNTIEIECTAQLKQFNFLYNTASTRAAIVQALTPILQVMQISGAIETFTITCDDTNNTPEIIEGDYGIVDIDVWFNHGMEKILTRIKVNRYGTQNSSDAAVAIE